MANPDTRYSVILVTAGSAEEAQRIAQALVKGQLAACCNILPAIRSIYRWQGSVQDDEEWLLIIKSTADRFSRVEARVRELHSYEVPEVLMLPVAAGSAPYLSWIDQSFAGSA